MTDKILYGLILFASVCVLIVVLSALDKLLRSVFRPHKDDEQ